MRIISFALVASLLTAGSAQAQSLPALGTDPAQTSVSGLSSGGFMAAQFHVAYSASLRKTPGITAPLEGPIPQGPCRYEAD